MTNYEAFVKALFDIDSALCESYETDDLSTIDGATYDFYERYLGLRAMLKTLEAAAEWEKKSGYYYAYKKAEAAQEEEERSGHLYSFGKQKVETNPFAGDEV